MKKAAKVLLLIAVVALIGCATTGTKDIMPTADSGILVISEPKQLFGALLVLKTIGGEKPGRYALRLEKIADFNGRPNYLWFRVETSDGRSTIVGSYSVMDTDLRLAASLRKGRPDELYNPPKDFFTWPLFAGKRWQMKNLVMVLESIQVGILEPTFLKSN